MNDKKLAIGERFTYKDIEWICLDIINGNFLAITANVWKNCQFDTDNCNNWKKSSLRRMLNKDFLDKLNKNHFVIQTSDLTADNGDKSYGTCEDYVTILSCDQYRKYRDLMPHYQEWMWTLTPWNCYGNGNGDHIVRSILPSGNINYGDANYNNGVAPVCLFSSKHLKLCRQAHLVEIDESAEDEE